MNARRARHTLLGVAAALAILPACASVRQANPARAHAAPARMPADAWPDRRTHDLDAIAQTLNGPETRTSVFRFRSDDDTLNVTSTDYTELIAEGAAPAGRGVVRRVYADLDLKGGVRDPAALPELEFIAFAPAGGAPDRAIPVSAGGGFDFEEADRRFTLFPPTEHADSPAGLLIHLHGLSSVEQDSKVRDAFRRRGWYAVEGCFVSMFTSDIEADFDAGSDLDAVAGAIARAIDARLGERADAVAAVVEYMRHMEPALRGKPVVIAGYSAGALPVPTIVAFRPDLYDAIIIVAGGANLLDISNRSSFASFVDLNFWASGLPPTPEALGQAREEAMMLPRSQRPWREPDPAVAADIAQRYLAHARLDPYHTAPTITDVPTLLLTGATDTWVPASTTDLLDERLARPERWRFPGGHKLVFWRLPTLAGAIARWAERQTRPDQ